MARNELIYTVEAEGRDKGKKFIINELPASAGEWWAIRMLMALSRGGQPLDFDPQTAGFYELAMIGLRGLPFASPAELHPLLAEMMDTITVRPDPGKPEITRALVETDIEEIQTRFDLRQAWLQLHMGFLRPVAT